MGRERHYFLPQSMNLIVIATYKVRSHFECAFQNHTRERGIYRRTVSELRCGLQIPDLLEI